VRALPPSIRLICLLATSLGGGRAVAGEHIAVTPGEGVSVEVLRIARQPPLLEVTLDVEVVDADRAQIQGFSSMRTTAEVNCKEGLDRVREVQVFDRPNLAGQARPKNVKAAWVRPSTDAYMSSVVRKVCGGPSPPQAAPPRKLPAAASAEGASVQIASSPSEVDARRRLAGFDGKLPANLATRIEVAAVGGHKVYRSVIGGFGSLSEARQFCNSLIAGAKDCLVRRAGAPASRPNVATHMRARLDPLEDPTLR